MPDDKRIFLKVAKHYKRKGDRKHQRLVELRALEVEEGKSLRKKYGLDKNIKIYEI